LQPIINPLFKAGANLQFAAPQQGQRILQNTLEMMMLMRNFAFNRVISIVFSCAFLMFTPKDYKRKKPAKHGGFYAAFRGPL
jgi:hypothetical protein